MAFPLDPALAIRQERTEPASQSEFAASAATGSFAQNHAGEEEEEEEYEDDGDLDPRCALAGVSDETDAAIAEMIGQAMLDEDADSGYECE